jgi:hypothetical protein
MTKREFDKLLNSCRTPKVKGKDRKLDLDKVEALPDNKKKQMALFIIKNRGPLLVQLAEGLDRSWLSSMGYMRRTKSRRNPEFVFLHPEEVAVF